MTYNQNPDRVTPPVAVGAGVGLVIAALLKTWLDIEVDPADATQWWEWFTAVAVPAMSAIGGVIGARFKARNIVTPIGPKDVPRNQAGEVLVPATQPATQPTRAARPDERPWRNITDEPHRPPFDGP